MFVKCLFNIIIIIYYYLDLSIFKMYLLHVDIMAYERKQSSDVLKSY